MLFRSSLAGITLPDDLSATLSRLGNASIAMGLLAVGAGLRLSALHEARGLATGFLAIKLLIAPAIGLLLGYWLNYPYCNCKSPFCFVNCQRHPAPMYWQPGWEVMDLMLLF